MRATWASTFSRSVTIGALMNVEVSGAFTKRRAYGVGLTGSAVRVRSLTRS